MKETMVLGQTTTGPSPRLWGSCPWNEIGVTRRGIKLFDDFANAPQLPTSGVAHKYASWWDTGGTIQQGAGNELGELVLTVDADDNQAAEIQGGGNTGGCMKFIKESVGVPHEIWMEFRAKRSALVGNVFLGLMEEGVVGGDIITDAGALADKDCFGFRSLEATPTILNLVFKVAGQTIQVPITSFHTWVADTYVKFGAHYNYLRANDRKIRAIKNNVWQATGITKAMIDAATFPAGEELAPTIAMKNVTDIESLTVDWMRFAMVEK